MKVRSIFRDGNFCVELTLVRPPRRTRRLARTPKSHELRRHVLRMTTCTTPRAIGHRCQFSNVEINIGEIDEDDAPREGRFRTLVSPRRGAREPRRRRT